jgi:TetR/AcrR family transcriptional regulator, transcriptional repressor for nem operon
MSPRPADPRVRSGLLAAARDLFLAKGFAGTGIEEICAKAGVTKGALFHHFDGKDALAAEVLNEWIRAGLGAYSQAAFLREPSAVARVLGYVDFTIELSQEAPIGCLIGGFAQETWSSHPSLRDRCADAFRDWSAGLGAMLEEAKKEARRHRPFNSASVARHFVAIFEGAQILAKAQQSRRPVEEQLLEFRRYLGLLLGLDHADRRKPRRSRSEDQPSKIERKKP